jgi:hypothetical protein
MAEIIELRRTPAAARRAGAAGAGVAELVRASGLAGLVKPASQHVAEPDGVGERILPVRPELRGLLPAGGLRRGSTVAVVAPGHGLAPGAAGPHGAAHLGATSVLLALLAGASAAGSWCAVVGMPALGLASAAEFGLALERLALVPEPGPDWPTVVAALLDGIDVVVVAPPGPVAAGLSSRLAARARQRGSVLVPYGQWAGADIVLETPGGGWRGLGQGWGRLARRELVISSHGRGAAARPRQATLRLPLDTAPPPTPSTVDTPKVVDAPVALEAVG